MKWFELPSFNFFHSLNAWDEGDEIVFIIANPYPVKHVSERTHLVHSTVEEVRINLSIGIVSRKPLSSKCLEFGVINHKFITKKNIYAYMYVGAPLPKISSIVTLDFERAKWMSELPDAEEWNRWKWWWLCKKLVRSLFPLKMYEGQDATHVTALDTLQEASTIKTMVQIKTKTAIAVLAAIMFESGSDELLHGENGKEFPYSLSSRAFIFLRKPHNGFAEYLLMAETASELRERILLQPKEPTTLPKYDGRDRGKIIKEGGESGVLHDGLSFAQFMAAGSVAGMVEHMAMFPVDTLKTRMQMLASSGGSVHTGVGRALMSIMKSEGAVGFYRGIGAMGLGAGPAHAVYFSIYEVCKEKLGGNRHGHHPFAHGASGIFATVASDAVITPMDVVKQRLQLRSSPYRGVMDCIKRILREEGLRAFYVSYRTTVVMNAPFTAVHFATYEAVKKALIEISPENASEDHLLVHITAGGAAGALASAVTTPLDVVKTRLQCQVLGSFQRCQGLNSMLMGMQKVSQQ
eukprot:Gb_18477 [translate_table: standard]